MNLVDIIIPAFNCEHTLKQTVSSIQASGLQDYTIILVDDGSTDQTLSICTDLSLEFDNIQYVHQENSGVSAARNHGIKLSSGEYLLFFDADDTGKGIINGNKDIGAGFCGFREWYTMLS